MMGPLNFRPNRATHAARPHLPPRPLRRQHAAWHRQAFSRTRYVGKVGLNKFKPRWNLASVSKHPSPHGQPWILLAWRQKRAWTSKNQSRSIARSAPGAPWPTASPGRLTTCKMQQIKPKPSTLSHEPEPGKAYGNAKH